MHRYADLVILPPVDGFCTVLYDSSHRHAGYCYGTFCVGDPSPWAGATNQAIQAIINRVWG